ncbi:MAG: bile acid:sodium symporter family protein [Planctomycetota bacterium]|jgi:BASS family bile acid:Na+ symporter
MFNRILSFYTKYFAVWVIIFGILAYFFPAPFVPLKPYMDWFFALTMFGIGAILESDDFKRIAKRPVIVLIGCCAQFTIMPLGAFILAKSLALPPDIAVGLILTGCAPGAMASNVMCYIAKADTAYSVSLTTVSTLLCPVLTPALTYILARSILKISFWEMVLRVFLIVVLPLIVGFAFKYLMKDKIKKLVKVFPAVSVTFIILICAMVIARNKDELLAVTVPILFVTLILNIYGMTAGYTVGKTFKMETKRRRTLAIEIGMQNAGLGSILALEFISDKAAIPAVIFVFVCIITASIISEFWQRNPSLKTA